MLLSVAGSAYKQAVAVSSVSISMISAGISLFALVVSIVTGYFSLLRRGSLKMTKPTVIVFAHETYKFPILQTLPKIFLRTLLYSTGKRGHVIQDLFINLRYGEIEYPFHFWSYGDKDQIRGSGLFVGETGIAYNHHFTPQSRHTKVPFVHGDYKLEIFAVLVGDSKPHRLFSIPITITSEQAIGLTRLEIACFYYWNHDESQYNGSIEPNPWQA